MIRTYSQSNAPEALALDEGVRLAVERWRSGARAPDEMTDADDEAVMGTVHAHSVDELPQHDDEMWDRYLDIADHAMCSTMLRLAAHALPSFDDVLAVFGDDRFRYPTRRKRTQGLRVELEVHTVPDLLGRKLDKLRTLSGSTPSAQKRLDRHTYLLTFFSPEYGEPFDR